MDAKPWTTEQFREYRSHLTDFVDNTVCPLLDNPTIHRVVIHAPVKSGKREMLEYIAVRRNTQKHAMLSAWYRRSDEGQREEIEQHGVTVFSATTVRSTQACVEWIQDQLDTGVIVHLDECDYGSGDIQSLSEIWKIVRGHPNAKCILYSATPEEIICSSEVDHLADFTVLTGVSIVYTPPEGYCGPEKFLDAGLIHEADPFFTFPDYALTDQGRDIVEGLRQNMEAFPQRNIVVLRLSYSELGGQLDKKSNKAFYKFIHNLSKFPELAQQGDTPALAQVEVIVDKDDKTLQGDFVSERVEWSNKSYWDEKGTDRPILIVIDQTSSRSTEWNCHDRVFATHDFRHQIRFNTVSQAQERVNHYSQKYGGFQPIQVYGCVDVFLLSAKRIDYLKFYSPEKWRLKRITKEPPLYLVLSGTNTLLHPNCPPDGIDRDEARRFVHSLLKKRRLSARIQGTAKMVPVYEAVWKKMNPDAWDTEWPLIRDDPFSGLWAPDWVNTHDPFTVASLHRLPNGDWRGQHRGWRKLYWKDEGLFTMVNGILQNIPLTFPDKKNIKKVCYHKGEVGVLFLFTRREERKETLKTANSMYGTAI